MANKFYPALSTILSADQLPEGLNFVSDNLEELLQNIYYKDILIEKSYDGSRFSYKLDLVSYSQLLKVEIPGTGLILRLNPDLEDPNTNISLIPISFSFNWGILQFIKEFKLSTFSFEADAFQKLLLQITRLDDRVFLTSAIETFINADDQIGQFIINTNQSQPELAIPYPPDPDFDTALTSILAAFQSHPDINLYEFIFQAYIIDATSLSNSLENLGQLYFPFLGIDAVNSLRNLFIPKISASVQLYAGLEFPRSVLIPVDINGNVSQDPNIKTDLLFGIGNLDFDSVNGFGFRDNISVSFPSAYPKAQIANSGIVIGFKNAKLDVSTTTNIPEADAAGYPVDFVGLYIQQATIEFNKFGKDDVNNVSASLTVLNFLIGTGGVSGTIALSDDGILYRKFGNFSVELDTFSITFRQNAIVNSSISGKLILPSGFNDDGVPSTILIDATIRDNGDFSVTAKVLGELPSFTLPNVFKLSLRSLTIGEKGGRFFIAVAGTLDFIANIPVLGDVLPKGIIINKLVIWDNGDLEFDGGGLTVPKAFKLSVGPVKLEVSHLSLGSYSRKLNNIDREYYYFGFDGMVNTGSAGIEASGNGIKYYFTHDNNDTDKPFDSFISIDGIAIDITIPGDASKDTAAFTLDGYLSMKNPDPTIVGSNAGVEYTGKVSFAIPRLKMAGTAAMRLQPNIPAFVVDIGLELPTAIPLGGTGLGIYAFRGLIGQHYLPSKSATTPPLPDDASWWEYYKSKSKITKQEGIEIDKFASESGFSIGAGISLATDLADSGFILSTKLFLLLGLPDVFLIQGQASILRSRLGLTEDVDPPFSALIVFSSQSITGDLDVNFKIPDNGVILSLQAHLDMAFYFNNISGWHLNIGKDTPASAQVQASILSLFKGHAYLMISTQGIKAGAGISFDFNMSFGPVAVGFGAALNMGGSISFKPVQIGAFINVSGYAYLKVFWFKLGLEISLGLAVEVPNPFNIQGSVHLKIKTPWPLPDVGFDLSIGWHKGGSDDVLRIPIPVLALPDPSTGYNPAAATNILTNEVFPINYVTNENAVVIPPPGDAGWVYNFTIESEAENVTIPLDSFIDIELLKAVMPGNVSLGGASNQLPVGYSELIPPQKGIGSQIKHQYEITGLNLFAWSDSSHSWVPYNIYEAVTAIVDANTGPDAIDLTQLKSGYWQFTDKNKYNKIRLMSQNMFSYMNGTTNTQVDLDARDYKAKDVFCYDVIQKNNFVNWKSVEVDTVYAEGSPVSIQTLIFNFTGVTGTVKQEASFGDLSLLLNGVSGNLSIVFPVPVAHCELDFGDNLNLVTVNFIQTKYRPGYFADAIAYDQVVSTTAFGQQNAVITYDNLALPISKITIDIDARQPLDYDGDLVIGGHFQLSGSTVTDGLNIYVEQDKSVLFTTLYNRSFSANEILTIPYEGQPGIVAQWPLDSAQSSIGNVGGLFSGNPETGPGFYLADSSQTQQLHPRYEFTSNSDALFIPYAPALKIENSSFAFEVTAVFNPFTAGISTLLYKVKVDPSGVKKGFALHLVQSTPAVQGMVYGGTVPAFTVLLTCYNGLENSERVITEFYTLDCASLTILPLQYKRIFVSVNRDTGKVDMFIDRILKNSSDIPPELAVVEIPDTYTYLNQLSYISEVDQARLTDNQLTEAGLINEVQVLSDTINKTVQPIWRPDTIFAVQLTTQDRVNGNVPAGSAQTHVFGFRTAGPLGHFHQQSKIYQQLLLSDQADAFKLSNLRFYIDYDRSFPDAQGRYNLSKPVLYHDPQVRLYFTQPYINAMYANWDAYQGIPAVQSSLELQLIDPSGVPVTQELIWDPVKETTIDDSNYLSLPPDQQLIYLFNKAAAQGSCNPMPSPLVKKLRQGSYHFPDLTPHTLYTALFNAVYQPDGTLADRVEVFKFSFISSRFATFEVQASSFILDSTPGSEKYAIYKRGVSFTADYIDQTLKKLINDDPSDDPSVVLQYAIKYERLVFGGLHLPAPEPFDYSVIQLIVNTDPADSNLRKILGILVYNPEPFNDPKLPADDLTGTIAPTLTLPDTTILGPDQFINCYSRDNSAVFITNSAMDIPLGQLQLYFRYKIFNGTDYETDYEEYTGPAVDIAPYFNQLT